MERLIFELKNGSYLFPQATSPQIEILGLFLSDVNSSTASWLAWLDDPNHGASGNSTIAVRDDKEVTMWFMYDEKPEFIFKISIPNYIKLLTGWAKLYEEQPQEITITIDDQNLEIEGRN